MLDAWKNLDGPFRRCLELAWESYRSGSVGVGAVLTAADGSTVAEGRSRWYEPLAPGADVAGSKVSHAETEALAQVAGVHDLAGPVLWTSLEPCVLCAGAIVIAHVPAVRYLGADALMAGLERMPELNPFVASRWPQRDGPIAGPFGAWSSMLPVARYLLDDEERNGEPVTVGALRQRSPRLAALAEEFAATAPDGPLLDVLTDWWDPLTLAVT